MLVSDSQTKLALLLRGAAVAALLTGAFGCSVSLFTGDKKNDYKGSTQSSAAKPECKGMDLSKAELTVSTFRQLTHCLNGNGSIQAYDDLINSASDQQLDAILVVTNRELAMNKPRLSQLDRSFRQMSTQGSLARVFALLDRHLSDPSATLAGFRMLNSAALPGGEPDAAMLSSIRFLAERISKDGKPVDNLTRFLDGALAATGLPSWEALALGARLPIPGGRPLLRELAQRAFVYAQEKTRNERELGRTMAWGLADRSFFAVLDHFYSGKLEALPVSKVKPVKPKTPPPRRRTRGATAASGASAVPEPVPAPAPINPLRVVTLTEPVRARIARLDELMRFLMLERKGDVLEPMARLFSEVNGPIACMEGTKRIPNGATHIMNELVRIKPEEAPYWLLRKNVLKMKIAGGMCDMPSKLDELMNVFEKISDGDSNESDDGALLVTTAQLIHALKAGDDQKHDPRSGGKPDRYRDWLVNLMGDVKPMGLVSHFADAAGELLRDQRVLLPNVLALLESDHREPVSDAAAFFVEPRAGSATVFDILGDGLLRMSAADAAELVVGLSRYLDDDSPVTATFLSTVREAMLMNDAHPILDALLSITSHAEENAAFFKALLELSAKPEFDNALRQTAAMARSGTLKDLLEGMLMILGATGDDRGAEPNLATVAAPAGAAEARRLTWTTPPRRLFSTSALTNTQTSELRVCRGINLDLSLSTTSSSDWSDQLVKLAACAGADGSYRELERFARYATDGTRTVRNGKPLARFLVDEITELFRPDDRAFKKALFDEAGDLLVDNATYRDVLASQDLARFYFREKYCTTKGTSCASRTRLAPMQAIARLGEPLAANGPALQDNLNLTAKALEHRSFAPMLRLTRDAWRASEHDVGVEEPLRPEFSHALMVTLKAQIPFWEGPQTNLSEAVSNKIKEYYTQMQSGVRRFSYNNAADFKATMKPLLDRLSDSKWKLYEQALRFMYRFADDPYDPEWWTGWFQRLAGNVRVIPYYYPGMVPDRDKPVVRIVSQLDLLELVVIDADFSLEELEQPGGFIFEDPKENFAIRYLGWLSEAGDDLDGWVKRLKTDLDKYYSMGFDSLVTKHGFKPELRRRIFNLEQIFPLLPELAAVQEVKTKSGRRLVRNDLGLLRDLFHDMLEATPSQQRHTYTKGANSLSAVLELVHFGLLRNIGASFWSYDHGPQAVDAAPIIRLLVESSIDRSRGSRAPRAEMLAIFEHLLRDDVGTTSQPGFGRRYATIGKIIDAVFSWTSGDPDPITASSTGRVRKMSLFKAASYELGRLLDQLNRNADSRGEPLVPELVRTLRPMLGTEAGSDFLSRHVGRFERTLADERTASFAQRLGRANATALNALTDITMLLLRGLSESNGRLMTQNLGYFDTLIRDPKDRFDEAFEVLDNLARDRDYKAFRKQTWDSIDDRLLRWFENSRDENKLATRLRQFMARKLREGDMAALIKFLGRESVDDRLYEELKFLGEQHYINGTRSALDLLRTGLEDTIRR